LLGTIFELKRHMLTKWDIGYDMLCLLMIGSTQRLWFPAEHVFYNHWTLTTAHFLHVLARLLIYGL
jgi:hypothetical protein